MTLFAIDQGKNELFG